MYRACARSRHKSKSRSKDGALTPGGMSASLRWRTMASISVSEIDAIVARAFRPARATDRARILSASWGSRERFIVEQLDGVESYEAIAARWTDGADAPMIAAQVKVFVDQLADQGLVDPDA